jgi:hypothetical protein
MLPLLDRRLELRATCGAVSAIAPRIAFEVGSDAS